MILSKPSKLIKMKKILLLLFSLSFMHFYVLAQICPNDTTSRGFELPFYNEITGFHNNLSLTLPGATVAAKSDSFMNAFINAYPAQLGDKELSRTGVYTSISSSIVEYHQHSNGVRVKGRRILLVLDSEEVLQSFDVYLVMDTFEIDTIHNLTAAITPPENYFVSHESGDWTIQPYYEPLQPQICGDQIEYEFEVGRPDHVCCDFPEFVSRDITVGDVDDGGLPFLKSGDDEMEGLCGVYANLYNMGNNELIAENPVTTPYQDNCKEEEEYLSNVRPLYETTMCYYYLNSAFHYINTVLSPAAVLAGIGDFELRKDILFDPFLEGASANYSLTYENNVPVITFKGWHDGTSNCPFEYNDYAEDADFIVETAFELLIREKFVFPKFGTTEGLGEGTAAFFSWKYMKSEGNEHTAIGNYGGKRSGGTPSTFEIPILLDLMDDYEDRPGIYKARNNAGVWATTLKEIYIIFSTYQIEDLFFPVLMKSMKAWNEETNQYKAAVLLYNELLMLYRMPESKLLRVPFCEIANVLFEKYADVREGESEAPGFEFADLYIRDTEEVLTGMVTPEDLGNEPNNESKYYDHSPSIWNCLTGDCLLHQRPKVGINNINTIRVAVTNRDQGCVWTGKIEIYANLSSTCDQWPLHWGGDIDGDSEPDDYYTTVNGSYILAAKKVAEIDMETGVYIGDDDERIYSVVWTPWQPAPSYLNLKYFENKVQEGFLARIKSDYDIMTKELHTNSNTYVKENNNVAQRKINSFVIATFPNQAFEPLLVKKPLMGDPDEPISLRTNFQMPSYVTEDNFDTLGSIRFLFPPELVDIFDTEAPVGTGFQWMNDSMILVTSPDFKMSMLLDTGVVYPVVLLHQIASTGFIPFSFQLAQFDSEECYEGGQYFVFTQDAITPRSSNEGIVEEQSLLAFPNPTNDNMTIRFDDVRTMSRITVYDITGKRMFQSNEVMTEYSFSTLQWPGGFYLARVQDEKGLIQNVSFVHSIE